MLYTCNHSGWHDAKYAAKFGVVSYDWSNAKALWAQNQPMNCEEMLTEQAERVLKEDPGIVGEQPRVWVYRNTIKLSYHAYRALRTFALLCMHQLDRADRL